MALSDKALEEALIQGTCDVFEAEPEGTSVNKVRQHVEEKLELDVGFFTEGDWKQRSKEIIKGYVGKLLDGWKPEPKANKKKSFPSKKIESQAKPSRKSKARGTDKEDQAEASPRPSSSPERKRKRAANDEESGDEAPTKEEGSDNGSKSAEENGSKPEAPVDEEEEYSDVIDEPPAPKRKKTKKDAATKPAKSTKASKSAAIATKSNEPDDPLEAEIKKLQSQLTKCGVRKLWHNELKSYGDDARAKIRHLKKMLSEVGMDGRFSEAKAREIKETRELLADAEAAQEMNRLWGTGSGGRSSRNKGRAAAKVVESDGSDAEEDVDEPKKENDDDDEDGDVSFAARRRRAQADLAFLGDESDSD